jgi:hypothetical protein
MLGHFAVARGIFILRNGGAIPVEAKPVKAINDGFYGVFVMAGAVCVFYPQQEFALMFAGIEPVEQGCAGPANMQIAGGGRGEAGDDWFGHKRVLLSVLNVVKLPVRRIARNRSRRYGGLRFSLRWLRGWGWFDSV